MSKIGRKPIKIPEEVSLEIKPFKVEVKGPKGDLVVSIPSRIKIEKENDKIRVLRVGESGKVKALHGLIRMLIKNAVVGVTEGFKKTLEIKGVGYRVKLEAEKLVLTLGYSHGIEFKKIDGIDFEVKGNKIAVLGINKQLVGQIAADIRKLKPPGAYKGKGIRYEGEVIKLKPGKAAKTAE